MKELVIIVYATLISLENYMVTSMDSTEKKQFFYHFSQ